MAETVDFYSCKNLLQLKPVLNGTCLEWDPIFTTLVVIVQLEQESFSVGDKPPARLLVDDAKGQRGTECSTELKEGSQSQTEWGQVPQGWAETTENITFRQAVKIHVHASY